MEAEQTQLPNDKNAKNTTLIFTEPSKLVHQKKNKKTKH